MRQKSTRNGNRVFICQTRTNITTLPSELWLMIFDIVITEAIIWLEHCDYITFPDIESLLSSPKHHYQLYESYRRMRLVCRRFNALLGDRPSQSFLDSTSFPLSTTTRALYLNLDSLYTRHFQLLLSEPSTCGRLVYLDVTCSLSPSVYRTNLSHFLAASAGQAFPSAKRLSIRLVEVPWVHKETSFWTVLHRAFPLLVTLVISVEQAPAGYLILSEMAEEIVTFELVDTFYTRGTVIYSGCHFPRLRQASVWSCSHDGLEILTLSSRLESLFIRSFTGHQIDVSSCLRLKLLGVQEILCSKVAPLERDHPLEHLWLFFSDRSGDYGSIKELVKRQPGISRVTIDLSSLVSGQWQTWITGELQAIEFSSIGMNMRPSVQGDSLLVIERSPASAWSRRKAKKKRR